MKRQTVGFVMLTYYPDIRTVSANLKRLSNWSGILVDNTPEPDRKKSMPEAAVPANTTLIRTGKNTGYAGGMNFGLKAILPRGTEWTLILNDDLVFPAKIAEKVISALRTTKPGITGPFAGILDRNRWTTIYSSERDLTGGRPDYISGSFMAVHRSVFDRIGLFYDPYFAYYEDVEYNIRAGKAGFVISLLPVTGIIHRDASRLGSGSFLHQYYNARNHLLFVRRNAPLRIKTYETVRLPKTLHEHMIKGEKGSLSGIRDYVLHRFGEWKGSV